MKITIISGSHRKNANTVKVCKLIEETINQKQKKN